MEDQVQEEEDRRRMLEDVQSDKATISRALTQNRTLKDQLAELQNGFVKLVRLKISVHLFSLNDEMSAVIYIPGISLVSVRLANFLQGSYSFFFLVLLPQMHFKDFTNSESTFIIVVTQVGGQLLSF